MMLLNSITVATIARNKVDENSHTAQLDTISNLPLALIKHILSFVPTVDAVRMSLLLKQWRRMWFSIPELQFCDSEVGFKRPKDFKKFIANCLKFRKKGMLT